MMQSTMPKAPGRGPLRVLSLLPSATENCYLLLRYAAAREPRRPPRDDGDDRTSRDPPVVLVGRSHECDYPSTPDVQDLPVLTAPRTAFTTSADVHQQVRDALAEASSLYHLDAARLIALAPDVILTQSTCKVCSIDLASIESALLEPVTATPKPPDPAATPICRVAGDDELSAIVPQIPGKTARIVTTNPMTMMDALVGQFQLLGRELGLEDAGEAMAHEHLERIQALRADAQERLAANARRGKTNSPPRVLLVEWLEPLFIGKMGWMRDLIEYAGGVVVEALESSPQEPSGIDVVVVALCGLDLKKTEQEIASGRVGSWWREVQRQSPSVYFVDGTAMFTRPTPRLLLALEWLVNTLHDDARGRQWLTTTSFPFKELRKEDAHQTIPESPDAAAKMTQDLTEIEELHRLACVNRQQMYTDPATGYSVMTAYGLKEKQVCCGNGCRHCPFGHVNVRDPARRRNKLTETVMLKPKRQPRGQIVGGSLLWPASRANSRLDEIPLEDRDLVVMFWSGGKDSLLALTTLYSTYASDVTQPMPQVVLLTSIDPITNTVPIQNIRHQDIVQQATTLGLPLCLVAVGLGHDYARQISEALVELPTRLQSSRPITKLVFGDLHLSDIRQWREQNFGSQYALEFPLWRRSYEDELLPLLRETCERTGARVQFSNIESDVVHSWGLGPGDEFDAAKLTEIARRQASGEHGSVDLMGECGEFHTCVVFPGMRVTFT